MLVGSIQLTFSAWLGIQYLQRSSKDLVQLVKNLPAVQETRVPFLGWEDPLEKEMATHSSIFAWKISWTEKPGGLQSMELQRVGTTERLTLACLSSSDLEEELIIPDFV